MWTASSAPFLPLTVPRLLLSGEGLGWDARALSMTTTLFSTPRLPDGIGRVA